MPTVREFETVVYGIEGIRIIVRANQEELVEPYNYQIAAPQHWTINEWLDNRVRPCIGEYDISVTDGNGNDPHRLTQLRNVVP